MDNLLNRRAMAISMVIGLTMMALVGFAVLADVEPPLTTPTFAITDTYGTADDQNAYVGDTFSFAVDAYGAPNNNSNISGEVTIGAFAPIPLVWNTVTNLTWDASYVADTVGTFAVNISLWDINAPTNMISDLTKTLSVWEPVSLDATFVLPTLTEDTETAINLSDAFLPLKDLSGAVLAFGYGAEQVLPVTWTANLVTVDVDYTHLLVTPPADWSGWQLINITAEDANGEGIYHVFNLTVGAVNDGPSLDYLYTGGAEYYPEVYNQTTEWNETDVPTAWRIINVVNLTMDEDTKLQFDVNATDVDDTELTYEVMFEDASAPLTIEVATVIVNTTTNETAEVPNSFIVTPEANLNGWFIGTVNVSDAAGLYDWFWFQVEVAPVNDAPTGTVTAPTDDVALYTGANFTLMADVEDIDGDAVTVTWLVGGVAAVTGTEVNISWIEAGLYNITCSISDGTVDVPLEGYWIFNVTVEFVPNTPPEIISVTVSPDVDDFSGLVDWIANREVEEGTGLDLVCLATDADGDTLTYTWTHDQDATWSLTGASVVVPADDLKAGKTYVFTCTVSDGEDTDSMSAAGVKIVKEDDDGEFGLLACLIPIIIIAIIIIVIVVVLILVLKGKKKEEVPPAPPEGEVPAEGAEAPVEGEVPAEGAPVEGEVPAPETPTPEAPAPEAPAPEAPQAPQ